MTQAPFLKLVICTYNNCTNATETVVSRSIQFWWHMHYAFYREERSTLERSSLRPVPITFAFWRGYRMRPWRVIWIPDGEHERLLGAFTKRSSAHLLTSFGQESIVCQ